MDNTGKTIQAIIAKQLKPLVELINKRFDSVDKRFEDVDKRFDKVEKDTAGLRDKLAFVAGDVASMKVDIKYLQEDTSSFTKTFEKYKDSFLPKLDQNLAELKKIRDDQAIIPEQYGRCSTTLEDHEQRLKKLEKPHNFLTA